MTEDKLLDKSGTIYQIWMDNGFCLLVHETRSRKASSPATSTMLANRQGQYKWLALKNVVLFVPAPDPQFGSVSEFARMPVFRVRLKKISAYGEVEPHTSVWNAWFTHVLTGQRKMEEEAKRLQQFKESKESMS